MCGLACLTFGGGLSLAAAAAAAALLFCFRAQAAVPCSAMQRRGFWLDIAACLFFLLSNMLICCSQVAVRAVHGPPPKPHQEQKGGEAMR